MLKSVSTLRAMLGGDQVTEPLHRAKDSLIDIVPGQLEDLGDFAGAKLLEELQLEDRPVLLAEPAERSTNRVASFLARKGRGGAGVPIDDQVY